MRKATFDPAKRLDLYFRINRNGSKAFNFLNVDGSARSLIYETYSLVIKAYSGGTILITLPLTIVSNVVTATITEELSRVNEGEYFYELIRTDVGKTYLCGKAVFHNGVFDGVTTDTNSITIAESTEAINIVISESGGIVDPIVYESGNAIEVGEDNKIGWGNQFTKNTTIPGDSVNLQFGTTDSRLNRFIQHVSGLVQNFIQAAGAWLTVVGTAQVVITEQATSIENDNVVGFKKQGDEVNALEIVTVEGDERVSVNVPFVPQNIPSQEELDALSQSPGAIVYRDFGSSQNRQPVFSDGGTWRNLRQILGYDINIVNNVIFGTNQPIVRIVIGENFSQLGYYFEHTCVLELLTNVLFTLVATADYTSGDQQILSISRNAAGTYIVTTKIFFNLVDEQPTWAINIHVAGPSDISQTGYLVVVKDPSEFFDIAFTGTIASNDQLIHRYSHLRITTAE